MNNQERQALIDESRSEITRMKRILETGSVAIGWARAYEKEILRHEIVLAALTAEPVAFTAQSNIDGFGGGVGYMWPPGNEKPTDVALYANPIDNTAQQYEALAGWKMVPVEPTQQMRSQIHPIADGNCSHCGNRTTLDCEGNMLLSWRDMLEAAPKPEGEHG